MIGHDVDGGLRARRRAAASAGGYTRRFSAVLILSRLHLSCCISVNREEHGANIARISRAFQNGMYDPVARGVDRRRLARAARTVALTSSVPGQQKTVNNSILVCSFLLHLGIWGLPSYRRRDLVPGHAKPQRKFEAPSFIQLRRGAGVIHPGVRKL